VSQTGKPDLQTSYLAPMNSQTGEVLDADGWYTFLNYYFWMQACVDLQVKVVLDNLGSAQGGQFADNTVIIFTADHGDYGGFPRPARQGRRAVRRGHVRSLVYQHTRHQAGADASVLRLFQCGLSSVPLQLGAGQRGLEVQPERHA
jgi:arylsulfatase A-like enzyme